MYARYLEFHGKPFIFSRYFRDKALYFITRESSAPLLRARPRGSPKEDLVCLVISAITLALIKHVFIIALQYRINLVSLFTSSV